MTSRNPEKVSAGGLVIALLVLFNAIVLKNGYALREEWYLLLPVSSSLLLTFLIIRKMPKPAKKRPELQKMQPLSHIKVIES